MSEMAWGARLALEATAPPSSITATWLAAHTDISCVQAFHALEDVEALARAAITHGFVSAHVLPHWMTTLRAGLDGTSVLAGGPVGFPSGGSTPATKIGEARQLLEDGAQELDVVANLGRLKSGHDAYVLDELRAIVDVAAGTVPLRVILELAELTRDELARGLDLAVESGAQYVKTGTGWTGRATTVDDITFIAARVQGQIAIKAAGGVRSLEAVRAMSRAGVVRFGVNAQVATRLVREAGDGTPT